MTEQPSLFSQTRNARTGQATEHPARWSDPDSSHIAITRHRQSGKLGAQRRMVLALLARVTGPFSARALANGDTALYYTLARRLPELKARGLADAEPHPDGQVWRITSAGRAALA
jgi:hypothetical protein